MVAPVSTEAVTNRRAASTAPHTPETQAVRKSRPKGKGRRYRVWLAEDRFGDTRGYLVTEPGDIDRPVAFLPLLVAYENDEQANSLSAAAKIAADPDAIWEATAPCLDLSPYGKLDSRQAMPGFVYGLRCRPVVRGRDEPLPVPPVEPNPFCRFRMVKLVEQHNRLVFSEEHRRQFPHAMLMIAECEDGSGSNVCEPVAPPTLVPVGPETLRLLQSVVGPNHTSVQDVVAKLVEFTEDGRLWEGATADMNRASRTDEE